MMRNVNRYIFLILVGMMLLLLPQIEQAQAYNSVRRLPPYGNQFSSPNQGCLDGSTWKRCASTAMSSGYMHLYAMSNDPLFVLISGEGRFNNDPPTGNSPQLLVALGSPLHVEVNVTAFGNLFSTGPQANSQFTVRLYWYFRPIDSGEWTQSDFFTWYYAQSQYGNGDLYFSGPFMLVWPNGAPWAGIYSDAVRLTAEAYTSSSSHHAIANWWDDPPYYARVDGLGVSNV